jgi:iron complex outermembrane receptor protein
MDAYVANDCPDGGSGVETSECEYLRSQVFPTGTQPIGLQRIAVQRTNGTYEITRGVDFFSQYDFYSVFGGTLSLGLEGTYTDSYRSGAFVQAQGVKVGDGGEFAGYLNDATPFTPKPKLKGHAFGRYQRGAHTAGLYLRYVDDYRDARPSIPELSRIEEFVTIDVNYNVAFSEELTMSISIFNLLDEDPPSTSTNLNYDALTHNGFGRSVKLGLVYRHPG